MEEENKNIKRYIEQLDNIYHSLEKLTIILPFNDQEEEEDVLVNKINKNKIQFNLQNNNNIKLTSSQKIPNTSHKPAWKKHKRTTSENERWAVSKVPLKVSNKQRSFMGTKDRVTIPLEPVKFEEKNESWCVRKSIISGTVPQRTPERKRLEKLKNQNAKILSVTILSGDNIPRKNVISPYVIIFLEEDISFKSRIKYNSLSPLWNECFEFELQHTTNNSLKVLLFNHLSSTNEQLIGHGTIQINRNLTREEEIWVTMSDINNISNSSILDIPRIQIKYEIIEVDTKSEKLVSLLLKDEMLSVVSYFVIENTKQESFGFTLIELLHSQNSSKDFIENIIKHPKSIDALLDKSSVLRKMIGVFCKLSRDSYIDLLQPLLTEIEDVDLEVRDSYIKQSNKTLDKDTRNTIIETNKKNLILYTTNMVNLIHQTIYDIIEDIRSLCIQITKKLKENQLESREIIADILFQKYLCPVIATPISYGLVRNTENSNNQSNIILAKLLVNMSQNKLFSESNELSIMNNFIPTFSHIFDNIYDKISTELTGFEMVINSKRKKELFRQHLTKLYCSENLEFWEDVQQYKALENINDRKTFATVINKLYLLSGAEKQINLDGDVISTIQTNLDSGDINIFDAAGQFILSLLQNDSFHKFPKRKSMYVRTGQQIHSKVRKKCLSEAYKYFLDFKGTLQQFIEKNQEFKPAEIGLKELDRVLDSLSFEYNPHKDVKVLNCFQKWIGKLPRTAWTVSISLLESIILLYKQYFGKNETISEESVLSLKNSNSFSEFESHTAELQYVKVHFLSENQKIAFWINIFNLLTLHSYISVGQPNSKESWINLQAYSCYKIDGEVYSLLEIEHCILRAPMNPTKWIDNIVHPKKFSDLDVRKSSILPKPTPYLCFVLCNGAAFKPIVKVFHPNSIKNDIKQIVISYIKTHIIVYHSTKEIRIPKLLKWYGKDIATDKRKIVKDLLTLYPESLTKQREEIVVALKSHNYKIRYNDPYWIFLPSFEL